MNIFIVFLTIIFITLLGFILIRAFNLLPKKDYLFTLALSYGLGVGMISAQLYIYSRLNIPWTKELLITPWLIIISLYFLKSKILFSIKIPNVPAIKNFDKLLIAAIILSILYALFEALLRPVTVWDGWAIWLLKSKIFFLDGRINPEVLNYVKSDYPLVISLLGTFIYIVLGKVDDTAVLLISFAFYLFVALAFFSLLKNKYGSTYALTFTLLIVSTQNFVRHGGRLEAGLADLPLGYFMFVTVAVLLQYLKNKKAKTFLLFSILLAITSLIKLEGIIFVILSVIVACFFLVNNRQYTRMFFLLIPVFTVFEWELFKQLYAVSKGHLSTLPIEYSTQKTIAALNGVLEEMLRLTSWNLLWIVYFATLIYYRKKDAEVLILNFFILAQLLVYITNYIFISGISPESSIERLLMHVAPLAFYSITKVFNNKQH